MKIVLYSTEQIVEFLLPVNVYGSFAFDEKEDVSKKLININAEDGNWYLCSTTSVRVFDNGNYTYNVKLETNHFYTLERDEVKYLIHTEDIYDDTFTKFRYTNAINLVVGNDNKCNVNYNVGFFNGHLFTIKYEKNNLILEKKNNQAIYINKAILYSNVDKYVLKSGDMIEYFGLKIIIFNGIIMINNPLGMVFLNNLTTNLMDFIINNQDDYSSDEVKEMDLYNENDYFSKSPRIRRTIKEKEIKIDGPPSISKDEDIPLIYTLGPMVTMGMSSAIGLINVFTRMSDGSASLKDSWGTIAISISMLATTLLWPLLQKGYNKREKKRKQRENIKKYRKYLGEKKKEIEQEARLQKDILIENLLPISECIDIIKTRKTDLWSRRIDQEDFLNVRIGIGDVLLKLKINCPEESFSIDDIPLKKEALSLGEEYRVLKDVPTSYSLLDREVSSVMGNRYKSFKFIENIILQLVTFHSYEDLKIVVFTKKESEKYFEYIKYLPHNFSNNKQFRFFASNMDDAKEVSNYLEQEINYRRYDEEMREVTRDYKSSKPYYLIITDNYNKIRKMGIMKILSEVKNNYGFSMLIMENKLSKLPSNCNNFISLGDKTSSILEDAYEDQQIINFTDEIDYSLNMNEIGSMLLNIPIEFENSAKNLPDSLTFLGMENVGKASQLNVVNRWKNNDPIKSLRAEVGIDENGDLMYLDLHEKYHGPHGLIAGMTGSGKSEFIITYVLSMAVNYSPNEVAFILIDYKGGGLAGAFENKVTGIKLPHLAGTITNLDKAEMDRTLVSIDSEVRRRQKVFNEARDKLGESTIDIYKYQKFYREGRLEEPIPHLIIICDEFAELKSQQPDFMDNLISIARIGRSLGVHLILATQKPSGVVNDQIWSNSKFRVCLKVQEKADSMEMLKRPEAAELKQVGRFYLQVGYNELFALGQSAYSGAKYYPSDEVKKEVDRSVDFINNVGYIIKSIQGSNGKKAEPQGEELASILNYIIETAQRENIFAKRLWLDNVPDIIYVDNLINKYAITFTSNKIDAILGEYDDPNNQSQGLLKVNLNDDGNIIVYGNDGLDKELFLDSLIYSTVTRHSSEEINYYIVDYGSEALRKFNNFPQVGDMVFTSEDEKLGNLYKLINNLLAERKKLFASFGGEYDNYIRMSGQRLPLVGIIINNYDAFLESNPNMEEDLIRFTRDGLRYGIFFVITANSDGSIRRKIKQNFNTMFALRLNDLSDYNTIFGKVSNLPRDVLGRGIFKTDQVYEFQTASVASQNLNETLMEIAKKVMEISPLQARRIPTLPKIITLDYMLKYLNSISNVPVGIYKSSLEIATYDFTSYPSTFILGTTSLNTSNFSRCLLTLLSKLKDIQILVIDMNKEIPEVKGDIKYYYDSNPEDTLKMLTDYVKKAKELVNASKTIIFFQNFNKFKLKLSATKIEELTSEIKSIENINIIIADDYKKIKKSEFDQWLRNIQNDTDGIWIGNGIYDQNLFKISKLTKEMSKVYKNNFGFIVRDGRAELFKTMELENFKVEDDEDE